MQTLGGRGKSVVRTVLLVGCALVMLGGCSSGTKVTRVEAGLVTDLSGRWNDTESRMVAETMVKEALVSTWLENYVRAKTRQPVAVGGTILNRRYEHINVHTFVTDLSRELTNSHKVIF